MSLVIVIVLGVGILLIWGAVKGESPLAKIQEVVKRNG